MTVPELDVDNPGRYRFSASATVRQMTIQFYDNPVGWMMDRQPIVMTNDDLVRQ